MRSLSTQETRVLAAPGQSVAVRVSVKDAGGSWVNLSALAGYDWVQAVSYETSVDAPFTTATVELSRDAYALSLVGMMTASKFNAAGVLLEMGRGLRIETATLPEGMVADGSTAWRLVFDGRIDSIDTASPTLVVQATDLGIKLQDAFIEEERVYGRWAASRAIRLGTVVKRSTDPVQGTSGVQAWRCTTAGTTGATEPSWPSSPSSGTTQSDGSVVWTYQAAAAWSSSSARVAGAIVKQTAAPLRYWTCVTSGTTGGSEPSWPSSPTQGQQVTDGSVVWAYTAGLYGTPAEVVMQSIIDDTLGAAPPPDLAADLPGSSSSYLVRPGSDAAFDIGSNSAWTAVGWMKLDSPSTTQIVMGLVSTVSGYPNRGWIVAMVGGKPEVGMYDGSPSPPTLTSPVAPTNPWFHVALVRNGGSLDLYLEGVQVATRSMPSGVASGSGVFTVGRYSAAVTVGSPFPMDGLVDEVAIFSRALSGTEIADLASTKRVSDISAAGLEGYWPLDGSGQDASGHDRHLAENSITYAPGHYPTPTPTSPQLSCPVSPGWYLGEFRQSRTTVWDALQSLTRQLGWSLRYVWSESDSAFVLRLAPIDRAPSSTVATLSPDRYLDVKRAGRAIDGIRNAVQVCWWDAEDLDAVTKAPKQKKALVTDPTSITAFGRRWMEVAEASASGIATAAIASQFAAAMLSDLSTPTFEHELELLYAYALELNDFVLCLANGRHYDLDQSLAVVSLRHRLEQGSQRTTVGMRGKPTAGTARYVDVAVAPRNAPAPRTLAPSAPAEVDISAHAIGAQVIWQQPSGRILPPGTTVEVHVSTTSGFTPDASTYRGDIAGGRLELSGLPSGTPHYVRVAYRSREGNLSAYSTERSFTPAQVPAADVEGGSPFSVKAKPSSTATFDPDSPIALGTEVWDQGGTFASSTLTVPSGAGGKWRIEARVHLSGATPGDRLAAWLNLNSGTKLEVGAWTPAAETTSGSIVLASTVATEVALSDGDTVKLQAFFEGAAGTKTIEPPAPTSKVPGTFFLARRMGS